MTAGNGVDLPSPGGSAAPAFERLRVALHSAGFVVERDFTVWRVVMGADGASGLDFGGLGVLTANRLWELLDRCAGARLHVRPQGLAARARHSVRSSRLRARKVPEDAVNTAARLRAELLRLGFTAGDFACCTADVTDSGMGLVRLGALPLRTVEMLTDVVEAFHNLTRPTAPPGVFGMQSPAESARSAAPEQGGAR